jgi:uncharacterized damage-inducible protein DinB
MTNLDFFRQCVAAEYNATHALLLALPDEQLSYRPHPVNRSAAELVEHIVAHVYDLIVILENKVCDVKLSYDFPDLSAAAADMAVQWNHLKTLLENYDEARWEKEPVELLVAGKPLVTLPRKDMMWFFFFDIIHHRGQLSAYVRPMGGKNPAVYGYSADTL